MNPPITCPNCGAEGNFRSVQIEDGGTGCLIFLFGGFLPALLHAAGREQKVLCENCGYVFTPQSSTSLNLVLVLLLAVVIVLLLIRVFVAR